MNRVWPCCQDEPSGEAESKPVHVGTPRPASGLRGSLLEEVTNEHPEGGTLFCSCCVPGAQNGAGAEELPAFAEWTHEELAELGPQRGTG